MVQEINLKSALNLITEYSSKYRNPNSTKLEISTKYYLFPELEDLQNNILGWPQQWSFCGDGGVYLILDENENVIYIGETTHFGNRFGSYFRHKNRRCEFKDHWNVLPYSIIQVKVPADTIFERLSLEEYLIKKLLPSENIRFKY